ncbi:MAG: 3-dehydroquinate synthase [Planctomycetes bacterium]|nr:3-dehydroquinate synthase [Planctomycetota bacterium]
MREVVVRAASRTCRVRIGPGLLAGAGDVLAEFARPGPALVVTDDNVGPLWLAPVLASLRGAGFVPEVAVVPAGEGSKTLAFAERLYGDLVRIGADRGTPVVALGGGMVTDLAGFVSATWLRGVPWLALPTSLLAMVDASVGGKTGVDLAAGKNLVGAFWSPVGVVSDTAALETLPAREFRGGLAEAAKVAFTLRPDLLAALEAGPERYTSPADGEALGFLVEACVEAKGAVVEADEREAGARRVLNFGHTAGHAIEAAAGYGPVRHGEAVAVGMVIAARISVRRGLLRPEDGARVAALLRSLGLPVALADLPVEPDAGGIRDRLATDKKRRDGRLALVLLSAPGRAVIVEDGSAEEVLAAF